MKYLFVIVLVTVLSSCVLDNSELALNQDPFSYNFYYDEKKDLYILSKYLNDSILIDTAFFYADSLKQNRVGYLTYIHKDNNPRVNQVVYFKGKDIIDSSLSYYFNVLLEDDSLELTVQSYLNDIEYLIIGEIDSNYNNVGRVDTFDIIEHSVKIPFKAYYKRGRIGIWNERNTPDSLKEEGASNVTGKELYIPKGMLEDAR